MDSGTTRILACVWGSSPRNVFAVGENSVILHYDGNSWSRMESGSDTYLLGVWGTSGNNVYAVGTNGTILHYGWH